MVEDRLHVLDLVRLLAASAVALFHWNLSLPAAARAAAWYPETLIRYGYLGVDLFFMVSGFVILLTADRPGMTWRRFAAARALRLFPAFWVCCLLTAAVVHTVEPVTLLRLLGNLTMMPVQLEIAPLDGAYWTLAAELQFYLAVGLLLAVGQLRRLEPLLWVALILPNVLPGWLRPVAADYAPMFAFGCACHLLRTRRGFRIYALLSAAALTSTVQAIDLALLMPRTHGLGPAPEAIAGGMLACQALMLAVAMGWVTAPRRRWILAAGAVSYPLYLLHNSIGRNVLEQYLLPAMPPGPALACVAAIVATAAIVVALVIEPRLKAALRSTAGAFPGSRTKGLQQ